LRRPVGETASAVDRVVGVETSSVKVDHQARRGHLLLADISGYTAFLTGTELEHAHTIIRELTALIRERLVPPIRFVKPLCIASSAVNSVRT
jgi:hypothetical protein